MAFSLPRHSTLLRQKLFPLRPASASFRARPASGHATSHITYGPEYTTHEGFRHPFFICFAIASVAMVYYQHYVPSEAEQTPWLTRYLSEHFSPNPQEIQETEAHNMAVVLKAADLARFKASIERPVIRRMANAGDFKIASPYGLVPGAQTDFSDLRIKTYRDDMQKPELPQKKPAKASESS